MLLLRVAQQPCCPLQRRLRRRALVPNAPSTEVPSRLVTGVSAGSKIAVSCTGLPPLHPYLFVGTSLVLAIDPAAAPLLSGHVTSLSGLMALLTALKEIDLPSATTPTSDLFGNLSVDWTVPRFQAARSQCHLSPNATRVQLGTARLRLGHDRPHRFKPVGAGSALFEFAGFPLFPPKPTLALSASKAVPNQTVSVSDAIGATTYWWLSTLSTLQTALGTGRGVTADGDGHPCGHEWQVRPGRVECSRGAGNLQRGGLHPAGTFGRFHGPNNRDRSGDGQRSAHCAPRRDTPIQHRLGSPPRQQVTQVAAGMTAPMVSPAAGASAFARTGASPLSCASQCS